jgi:hypothetical protein
VSPDLLAPGGADGGDEPFVVTLMQDGSPEFYATVTREFALENGIVDHVSTVEDACDWFLVLRAMCFQCYKGKWPHLLARRRTPTA